MDVAELPDGRLVATAGGSADTRPWLAWTDAQGNVEGNLRLPKGHLGYRRILPGPDKTIDLLATHRILRVKAPASCP